MKSEEPSGRVKPMRGVQIQDTQDSQEPLASCTSYYVDSNVKSAISKPSDLASGCHSHPVARSSERPANKHDSRSTSDAE